MNGAKWIASSNTLIWFKLVGSFTSLHEPPVCLIELSLRWNMNGTQMKYKMTLRPIFFTSLKNHLSPLLPRTPTHTRTHAHTHTYTHRRTHAHTQARQLLVISWLNFFMNFKTLVVKSRLITSNEEFWTLAGSDGLPRADQVVDGFDSVRLKSLFHVLSLIVSQIESDLRNPNFRFFFVRPEMLKMKRLSTKQNLTFYGHKTFFFLTLGDELN